MTSFAFIAGLIPLVVASGAGAIGNRTIGSSALGGMLVGTLIGVLVIPGLYYVFATMIVGRKLIQEEEDEPVSEQFIRTGEEQRSSRVELKKLNEQLRKLLKRKKDE
ncbi:MAG: efflux RND transporter permease subunit, partial [Flavobacteriales bacterium]